MSDLSMQQIEQLQAQLDSEKVKNLQMQTEMSRQSMFTNDQAGNLIEYQLDLREELERIEHLLRGDILEHDREGNLIWKEQKNTDLKPFNNYGVQLIMNVVSFYLNRNTILSNYDNHTINWKMEDLGEELADLIYMKYEDMGMDIKEKQKLYGMMVREIVDTVHSAYLRALNGGERDSLRTARHVTQADSGMKPQLYPNPGGGRTSQTKWWNPTTWGR